MLVGTGHHEQLDDLYNATIKAPLAPMNVAGAKGCLLQIEGGLGFLMSMERTSFVSGIPWTLWVVPHFLH